MSVSIGEGGTTASRHAGKRKAAKSQPGSHAGRSRLQVDERRAQLLKLGAHLFSRHSYDGLSVDDIAQAAGISKGLLYHYFPSKREFYVETIRAAAHRLLSETQSANEADPSLSPIERARAATQAYLDYAERHGSAFSALLQGGIGSDAEVFEIIEGVRREYIRRFMSKVEFLKPTPEVRTAVRGYLGFAEGATLDWLQHKDVAKEELRDLLLATLVKTVERLVARQAKKLEAAPQ